MTSETAPVASDEMLIRLIWESFFKPDDSLPVRPSAFNPRTSETDGISVFRLACMTSAIKALDVIAEEKRSRYAIVMIPASEIFKLGLTVLPAPIDAVEGHAVIPELNCVRKVADPNACQEIQMALAQLASANIVRVPTA